MGQVRVKANPARPLQNISSDGWSGAVLQVIRFGDSSSMKMGISLVRRGLGFCRLLKSRTICSSSGRISEKGAMSSSPWLMMPHVSERGKVALKFHRLGNKESIMSRHKFELELDEEVYFAGSHQGWLFVHNRMKRDFFMLDPISGRRMKLPSVDSEGGGVIRVALSCSPDEDEEWRAMIIFGQARRLAFCVPGFSTEWTPIGGEREREYDDVVYSSMHRLFFCIAREYEWVPEGCDMGAREYTSQVESWNIREPMCPRIDWRLRNNEHLGFDYRGYPWPSRSSNEAELKQVCRHVKYILVHGHDLFLVVRHVHPPYDNLDEYDSQPVHISMHRPHSYKTFDFDVYKIDWRDRDSDSDDVNVRYMRSSLDGLAMFVGNNHSFAMLASSDDHLKANCIYYSDDKSISFADTESIGHDNGIFDYQSDTFVECCADGCLLNPVGYRHIKRRIQPPPLWLV